VLAEGIAEVIRHMTLPPDTVLTWVTSGITAPEASLAV
jgi:hypothetical protein